MASIESRLIVSLLDRLTGPARAVQATLDRLTNASRANAARLAEVQNRMFGAAAAGYALYRGLSAPINAALEFESAMADVKKVVDFPTPDAFVQMGRDIRALSLEMPMAADGIAQIVAAAGQSGIASNELLPFATMAAKVGVAWEVSADQAGEALAKLKTALGMSVAETGSLADAINHLGNNSAASAPAILDVVRRVAPMASQFGLSAEQAAAFGAAMVGSGFEAEVASTSFMNMGRALTKGASATKRQQTAYKALGLTSKGVAKSMQKDAVGTIQDVLARINKIKPEARAALISDLFGDEARALGPLINNAELLAQTLGLVADKTKYAGSAQAEYEARSKTSANSLQLFRNRITDLGISIGNALLPALNQILGIVGPLVTSISDLAQRFPNVTAGIVGLTAAAVAFKIAAIGIQYGALLAKGGLIDMGIAVLSAGRSLAGLAIAPVVAGFTALRTAMIGFAAAGAIGGPGAAFAAMGSSLLGLLSPIRLVSAAFTALKLALVSTGIGAIVVGIAMAGTWIYNNWNGIARMFTAFGAAFMEAVQPIMPVLQPVIDGASSLYNWVSNLLGPVDGLGSSWFVMGRNAGKAVGDILVAIVQLPGKVAAMASEMYAAATAWGQGLYDGVVAKVDELVAWFTTLPSRIIAAIGRIDLSGLIKWPSLPGWLGGGGSSPEAPATAPVDGARADGGPVSRGKTYLVGERGPELFSPGQSGMISPNEAYAAARSTSQAAARQAPSISISAPVTVYAQTNANPEDIARAVASATGSAIAGQVEAALNDGGV